MLFTILLDITFLTTILDFDILKKIYLTFYFFFTNPDFFFM